MSTPKCREGNFYLTILMSLNKQKGLILLQPFFFWVVFRIFLVSPIAQLAKEVFGVSIVAATSSSGKLDLVKSLGADRTID